jgi:hypothetical protein
LKDGEKIVSIDTYLLLIILQNKIEYKGTRNKESFIKIFFRNFNDNYIFQNNLLKIELIAVEEEAFYKEISSINKIIKETFRKTYNDSLKNQYDRVNKAKIRKWTI